MCHAPMHVWNVCVCVHRKVFREKLRAAAVRNLEACKLLPHGMHACMGEFGDSGDHMHGGGRWMLLDSDEEFTKLRV